MDQPKVTSGAELRKRGRPFVTVPDTGNTYQMRHATVATLIKAGILPENYVAQQVEAEVRGNGHKATEPLTDKRLLESEDVQRVMLKATMINPRLVERATEDDEVEFEDMPLEDRSYLFRWAKREIPDQVLETADGEGVTVKAVGNFSEQPGQPSGTGDDGAEVGGEPVEALGVAG